MNVKFSENNLIWVDMEMTGLDPEQDRILEVAVIVTDNDLNVIAEAPVYAVHQSDDVLDNMNEWSREHHGKSGLTGRCRESVLGEAEVETKILEFLAEYVPANASPICGNSIAQDKRFIFKYMPRLAEYFHYRYLDVSTLKILAQRWKPEIMRGLSKKECHLALDDIRESIDELKYYREKFLK